MYEQLKVYDNIVANYLKTIIYIKNKLNSEVMEFSKQKELKNILNMLEKVE
jgi:ABC-type sugar transport system ATPase subunit